ncbi:MAG: hypothetical protein R3244_10705 [Thermoanaerobaculia bacterium]|nr:hypothetical protein [Thermoanaerobaculia bacterium]
MTSSDRTAVTPLSRAGLSEQLRPVMLLSGLQVLGMALFTIVAPRLMGPDLFGRFALILSLTTLWMTTATLGGGYVFGRFVPEYAASAAFDRVRTLFMHMVLFRQLVIAVTAAPLWIALDRLLPEATDTALALSVAAFAAITAASPLYKAYFGLNRLGVSMSKEALGRYLLLLLLIVASGGRSLERATLALLLANAAILVAGLAMTRRLFTLAPEAFDLRQMAHHIRFGLAIAAANLLLRLPWRLGEGALAYFETPAAEIAFFNIALSIVLGFTRIQSSLTTLLIPSMSLRQASGDHSGRDRSLGIALRFLTLGAGLFVLGVFGFGPWAVETLLGSEYLPVLPNLYIGALAALFVPFVRCSISLAVVEDRIRHVFRLGVLAVGTFGIGIVALVPDLASRGASAAVTAALAVAGTAAVVEIRRSEVLRIARCGRHLAAALPAAALLGWLGPSPLAATTAAGIYLSLVLTLGVTGPREISTLLRPPSHPAATPGGPSIPPDSRQTGIEP